MKSLFFLFSLLFSSMVFAQQRYIDDLFPEVEKSTEVYAVKDGEKLIVDIYQPAGDTLANRPLILFMHGGGFAGGSPRNPNEVRFAEMAAKKGYVAALLSYRLTRKGQSFGCDYEASGKIKTFREAADDFLDALSFMLKNRKDLGIDAEKIIVGGSSAGAEAVLNAIYNHRILFEKPLPEDYKMSGIFSLAGAILDARYISEENAVPGIFFHGTDDNLVPYATAPHHYCDKNDPGFLILDGSGTIVRKLEELDTSYLLVSYEDARHEISGMPFDEMPVVFNYFNKIFLNDQDIQTHIQKFKDSQ